METRAGYMAVGLFVLFVFGGILSFFLWIAKTDLDYKANYYTIYFPGSVTGLTIGGGVNYLGVPVGAVKKIELSTEKFDSVKVTVAIRNTVPIREGAFASLELQGLTGYKFVQISGGSHDSPLLKIKEGDDYPIIPSRYSGVEEIMTALPRMVNKFTNLIDRMNITFNEENRTRFANTLKNVESLSDELHESSKPLKEALESAQKTIATLHKEIQLLSNSSQITLKKIDETANDFSSILKENKAALNTLTQNGSYELLQTLRETREMITTAGSLFEKLDQNPRSLFFKKQTPSVSIPQ